MKAKLNTIQFYHLIFVVPSKYEALLEDYLNLGDSKNDKRNQYAPIYPMFSVRPSKRRQNSEQSLESSSEQSGTD